MEIITDILTQPVMGKALWLWVSFLTLVGGLLAADLGLFHKTQREVSVRESLRMCLFYFALACLFGGFVWYEFGAEAGADFYTGYFVELSLSMDNLFVMSLIFMHLGIPKQYQHRVLFWGILGVIFLRGVMIGLGVVIIERFAWVLLFFAGFLVFTGLRLLFSKDEDEEMNLDDNKILKFLKKHMHVTTRLEGEHFFVRAINEKTGKMVLYATPLFLALCLVEISDVIFAVDSIPAIFVITNDPYVIFTSNLFAILGLRSLFFALSAVIDRFAYMKYSLALILIFIGGKIFASHFDYGHLDSLVTLAITLTLLFGGVAFSMYKTRGSAKPIE